MIAETTTVLPSLADQIPPSIQERFDEFDESHPEVDELFVRFARELKAAGHTAYSADAILHRIRWHYAVNADRDEGFKINDHFSSRYGRKLTQQHPAEFKDFFQFRILKS